MNSEITVHQIFSITCKQLLHLLLHVHVHAGIQDRVIKCSEVIQLSAQMKKLSGFAITPKNVQIVESLDKWKK